MPARTNGEAIEVSYAQHVGKNASIGFSLVPKDSSSVTMVLSGQNMVESETKTDYGIRGGAVITLPGKVKFGFNYSYQHDKGTTRLNPLLTGAPDWVELQGTFNTRCTTVGLSKQVTPKALVYGSYQNITAAGLSTGTRKADMVRAGVMYNLTKNFAVRANYVDGGENYSFMYRSSVGILNVAYTHKALINAEDILGTGDAAFVALAVALPIHPTIYRQCISAATLPSPKR
jgi:predicted porin